MQKIDPEAARALMSFVHRYTDLLEKSLQGIHAEMRAAIEGVMLGINEMSKLVQSQPEASAPVAVAEGQTVANMEDVSSASRSIAVNDGDLQALLLKMMGVLSRDDIITQRIHHVVLALSALQASLTYVLTDYEGRCRTSEVERFANDLKSYIFKSYTMEEEKELFFSVFPKDRKIPRAG